MTPKLDPSVQLRADGPLTNSFQRVSSMQKQSTGSAFGIAGWAGFSGGFLGNVIRYGRDISTATATEVGPVVETLEAAPTGTDVGSLFPAPQNRVPDPLPSPIQQAPNLRFRTRQIRSSTRSRRCARMGCEVILISGGAAENQLPTRYGVIFSLIFNAPIGAAGSPAMPPSRWSAEEDAATLPETRVRRAASMSD